MGGRWLLSVGPGRIPTENPVKTSGFCLRLNTTITDLNIASAQTVDCLNGFRVRYRDGVWAKPHKFSMFFM